MKWVEKITKIALHTHAGKKMFIRIRNEEREREREREKKKMLVKIDKGGIKYNMDWYVDLYGYKKQK